MICLNSIRVMFSLAIHLNWQLYYMDIKNVFLYEDLSKDVFMEQPLGFVS